MLRTASNWEWAVTWLKAKMSDASSQMSLSYAATAAAAAAAAAAAPASSSKASGGNHVTWNPNNSVSNFFKGQKPSTLSTTTQTQASTAAKTTVTKQTSEEGEARTFQRTKSAQRTLDDATALLCKSTTATLAIERDNEDDQDDDDDDDDIDQKHLTKCDDVHLSSP